MIKQSPFISVVMSVYNAELYLAEAIESILQQSYENFEFIIVEDASTDSSLDILQSYHCKDNRVQIIYNEENVGLGVSLQKGIKHARGELIARMDADDISSGDRFKKQVDYLITHPDILVLGGDHKTINKEGKLISDFIYPKDPVLMRWNMLLGCGLIVSNGATMMRRKVFDLIGGYGGFRAAQDFELWTRLFDFEVLPIANLSDVIYYYRMHQNATSFLQNGLQEKNAVRVRQKKIEEFLGRVVSQEVVPAYRYPGFNYEDIETCVFTWIEIYKKFIKRFNVQKEARTIIDEEIFRRLNKYIFLNPFNFYTLSRVCFWRVLFSLPLDVSARLLSYKIRYLKKKS